MTKAKVRPWPATKTEMRPLADLQPYTRNVMDHSTEQVAQIAKSLLRFGWVMPALVDAKGVLIAGHGRVMAATSLVVQGHKAFLEVPIMVAEGWTKAEIKAYRIVDNQLGRNSTYNTPNMGLELGELKEADFDLTLTGFDETRLVSFITDDEAPKKGKATGARIQQGVISYNIVFDNAPQQTAWFDFIKALKKRYPDAGTIGERLVLHIQETPAGGSL